MPGDETIADLIKTVQGLSTKIARQNGAIPRIEANITQINGKLDTFGENIHTNDNRLSVIEERCQDRIKMYDEDKRVSQFKQSKKINITHLWFVLFGLILTAINYFIR